MVLVEDMHFAFHNYISIEQACIVVIRWRIHCSHTHLRLFFCLQCMFHRFIHISGCSLWFGGGAFTHLALSHVLISVLMCMSLHVCFYFRDKEQERELM